jgi:hypothetical protein
MHADTRSPTEDTIRERCRLTSATATFSTRCAIASCRRRGSRISDGSERQAKTESLSTMTLSAQLIAALAQVTRRLLVGLLLLAPSLGTAFAENLSRRVVVRRIRSFGLVLAIIARLARRPIKLGLRIIYRWISSLACRPLLRPSSSMSKSSRTTGRHSLRVDESPFVFGDGRRYANWSDPKAALDSRAGLRGGGFMISGAPQPRAWWSRAPYPTYAREMREALERWAHHLEAITK